MPPLTAQQLDIRRSGIGASETAAVLGVSPWQKPIDVFNIKLGLVEQETTRAMEFGSRFEDMGAQWYAEKTGSKLMRCNQTRRHPKLACVLATPDRWVVEERRRRRICEIKIVGHTSDDWGEDGSGEGGVPEYYLTQLAQQFAVTGMHECDVAAVFLNTRELRIYRVERNEALIEAVLEGVTDFWHNHVVKKVPPPLDGTEGSRTFLKKMFPNEDGEIIDAPREAEKWVAQYKESSEQIKALEDSKAEASNYLRAMIGPHGGMRGPWGRVTWKMSRSGGTDYKALSQHLMVGLAIGGLIDPVQMKAEFQEPGSRRFYLSQKRKD